MHRHNSLKCICSIVIRFNCDNYEYGDEDDNEDNGDEDSNDRGCHIDAEPRATFGLCDGVRYHRDGVSAADGEDWRHARGTLDKTVVHERCRDSEDTGSQEPGARKVEDARRQTMT
uniref:Uncharacterized protein n=1 Tax=Steinernema glaseri TaxID=37863 RepID=A0A1I7YCC8_9BILA